MGWVLLGIFLPVLSSAYEIASSPPCADPAKASSCQPENPSPADAPAITNISRLRDALEAQQWKPSELTLPKDILATPVPDRVLAQLRAVWTAEEEGAIKKTLLYLPRLVRGVFLSTLGGKTAQRVYKLGISSFQLATGKTPADTERAVYHLSNTPLNFPALFGDLISDATSLVASPLHATARISYRAKVCTNNLMDSMGHNLSLAHFVNPMAHVAVLIDDSDETQDIVAEDELVDSLQKKGGISCTPVPVYNGDTDSMFIERLNCTEDRYKNGPVESRSEYEFVGYNCGGFTRDILAWSGGGFPILPNAGVGADLQIFSGATAQTRRKNASHDAPAHCALHLKLMVQAAYGLETGKPLPAELVDYLTGLPLNLPSPDMLAQLLVSAARGGNKANRELMDRLFPAERREKLRAFTRPSGNKTKLKRFARKLLKKMGVNELNPEARAWLGSRLTLP